MPALEHSLPAYQQIARYYAEQIATGELAVGDRLPSERELIETWGVSKATANKATAALKAEGLVESRIGSGTVVADRTSIGPAGIGARDMFRRLRHDGRIRLPGERSIRTTTRVPATDVPGQILEVLGGTRDSDSFVQRRRVILRNEKPFSVAVSWFFPPVIGQKDASIVDRLMGDEPIVEGTPKFVANWLGVELTEANDSLSAIAADDQLSTDLGVAPSSPMLYLVSTIFAETWGPIEAGEYYYPERSAVNYRYEV